MVNLQPRGRTATVEVIQTVTLGQKPLERSIGRMERSAVGLVRRPKFASPPVAVTSARVLHFRRRRHRHRCAEVRQVEKRARAPDSELVRRVKEAGYPEPEFRVCDITDIPALQSTMAEMAGIIGSFDILVNNAANDQRHETKDVTVD